MRKSRDWQVGEEVRRTVTVIERSSCPGEGGIRLGTKRGLVESTVRRGGGARRPLTSTPRTPHKLGRPTRSCDFPR
ncbi:hypothetical protein Csa_020754 [Cucumis sativus]|nr:hypothetical protein Csa_020754 [Cucumis sativus]